MRKTKNVLFPDVVPVSGLEIGHRLSVLLSILSNANKIEAIKVFYEGLYSENQ